jgi:penicillin-binding protein 1A
MRKRSKKKKSSTFLKALKRLPLLMLLFVLVLLGLVYAGALGPVPSKEALKNLQHSSASEVYSADGVLLGRYYKQDRTIVAYKDISPYAVQALIATEDARFYEHNGIDYRSVARVFVKSLLLDDESSGGGSTLSQQLAKNVYPRPRLWLLSTPISKVREMIIATRLEEVYSKEEILALYFNTVPLGEDLYGIERASERFFSTSANKLKLEQAAVLVGMLKANTSYNPRLYPERSRQRRNVVLNQMHKYGYLKESEARKAKELPLVLKYNIKHRESGPAPYFREKLRVELEEWLKDKTKADGNPYNLYRDGLKIVTTLDATMQAHAEKAVHARMSGLQKVFTNHWSGRSPWENEVEELDKLMRKSSKYKRLKAAGKSEEEIRKIFQKPVPMNLFSWNGTIKRNMSPLDSLRYYELFLNTGLLSIEPKTGYIKAWVGGINHRIFNYDHVRSKRQVGSTFKPIVYAAALEKGITPCTLFSNERVTYPEYDNWSPRNSNGVYEGAYTMRAALAHSVNTISAKLLMQTGIGETVDLAHRMGIDSDLPEVPSLALGTADISLLEMVTAYTTFLNEGNQVDAVSVLSITDSKGNVLLQHTPGKVVTQALDRNYAATMLHLMQGVVEEGSAKKLRSEFGLQMDIAGKTGTTQNHSDGWFIGITADLVTGVWVGAESPSIHFRTIQLGQGANTALPVWGEFMRLLTRDKEFSVYRNSRFSPLNQDMLASLDCENIQREEQVKDEKQGFFDRILGIFGAGKRTEKEQRKDERERQQKIGSDDTERIEKEREKNLEWQKKKEEKEREREQKKREKQREREKKKLEKQREQEERRREKQRKENLKRAEAWKN